MTTNVLNNNFILTPQQQELLYAALASNRAAANPAVGNGFTVDPASFSQSPLQTNGGNGLAVQESPFLDYDYSFDAADSSFDFSFDGANDNGSSGKMIGDLPDSGSSSKEHSASPERESPDKRSHPDDEEDEEENDPKRRESAEKQPKKPGRKPLTSEPTTKRKAQNRAAQRAFRERKERHLKDLEEKVEELEQASKSASKENTDLRGELEKMSAELEGYKKKVALLSPNRPQQSLGAMPPVTRGDGAFGHSMVNNLTDVSFQFEFPKFGQLPGPQLTSGGLQSPAATKSPSSERSPGGQDIKTSTSSPGYTSGLDSQTKEDLAKFSGLFSPPLTNNNVASMSRGSLDSHYSVGANSTSSPSASSHSNMGPTSSCGTSPEPSHQSPMGFKPVDTLTTIGEETQDAGHFANVDVNDLSWLGAQNNFQFDPSLFGGYREPQENILASGVFDDSFFNDAFTTDFTTPYNMAPSPLGQGQGQKKDLIAQIDAAKESDGDLTTAAPPTYEGVSLTCNKIWEKLQNCPKVQSGDFDLDGLCSDLQKKAKCSGSGPVVDQSEFKAVMQKYLGRNPDENCLKDLS